MRAARVKEVVLGLLGDEPKEFRRIVGTVRRIDSSFGWGDTDRKVDRALQSLRKRGLAKHLRKADGGPGWVRVGREEA